MVFVTMFFIYKNTYGEDADGRTEGQIQREYKVYYIECKEYNVIPLIGIVVKNKFVA